MLTVVPWAGRCPWTPWSLSSTRWTTTRLCTCCTPSPRWLASRRAGCWRCCSSCHGNRAEVSPAHSVAPSPPSLYPLPRSPAHTLIQSYTVSFLFVCVSERVRKQSLSPYSLSQSLTPLFTLTITHSLTPLFTLTITPLLPYSLSQSLPYSPIHSQNHSLTYSPIHSHSLTLSLFLCCSVPKVLQCIKRTLCC